MKRLLSGLKKASKNIEVRIADSLAPHASDLNNIIYFPEPSRKIVSFSFDGTMNIYDSFPPYTKLSKLDYHSESVDDGIKWDKNSFLSAGHDRKVLHISVIPPFPILNEITCYSSAVNQIEKISETKILSLDYDGNVRIIPFPFTSKKDIVDITKVKIGFLKRMVKSKVFSNTCYIATDDSNSSMKFINYEKKIVRSLEKHKNNIIAAEVLKKSPIVEYLLVGGNKKVLFIYKLVNIDESQGKLSDELIKEITFTNQLYSIFCFHNNFLLFGDYCGTLSTFEIEKPDESINNNEKDWNFKKLSKSEKLTRNNKGLFVLTFLQIIKKENERILKMVVGSDDATVQILEIKNIPSNLFLVPDDKITKQVRDDLYERIDFLRNEFKLFIFTEELEKKVFLDIVVQGNEIRFEKIFRSILCN